MALETTTTAPKTNDFTALSEHQEQTPNTFYGAKPVLHLHSPDACLSVSNTDLSAQSALKDLASDNAAPHTNGDSGSASDGSVVITGLDIWVTSQHLTLFAPAKAYGVHIPYQSIVVHAAEGDEVLLGLNLSDKDTPDEDMTFVQLRLTPKTSKKHPASASSGTADAQPDLALFSAISACQELNPDPPEEGDEEAFDETAPGATGWITSENMADFMDENGEFKMPEGMTVVGADDEEGANGTNGLGEGAGRIRTAAEADGEDGVEDDTKWQRTG